MFLEKCQYYFGVLWDGLIGWWPVRKPEFDQGEKEKPIVKTRRKRGEGQISKNDLLLNLDKYFVYIKRMRKSDRESYDLYRQIGAQVLTKRTSSDFEDLISLDLPPRWKTVRPSFGCILIPHQDKTDEDVEKGGVSPSFLYFRKHKSLPSGVQAVPKGWDIYTFHLAYYIDKVEFTHDAAIAIDPNNQLHALRVKVNDDLVIKSKYGNHRGHNVIRRKKWRLPPVASLRKDKEAAEGRTSEEFICDLFNLAANFWELAQFKEVEVRAVKGSIAARFNISGVDTARLFQDRERTSDKKTRIFHAVRPYVKKSGAMVKLHFKGERKFNWNGYDILITVPGKDFAAYLPEFEAAAIPEEDMIEKGYDSKQVGKFIVDHTVKQVTAAHR